MFKQKKEKIALFGGSFDPPHFGHLEIIKESIKKLDIDKLIVMPTYLNPFKKRFFLTPKQRFNRLKEILKEYKNIEVSNFEIEQNRAVSTIESVKYLEESYIVKYIVIGADNLKNIDRWRDFELLNSKIIWVVATRDGYRLEIDKLKKFQILNIDAKISSSQIRKELEI